MCCSYWLIGVPQGNDLPCVGVGFCPVKGVDVGVEWAVEGYSVERVALCHRVSVDIPRLKGVENFLGCPIEWGHFCGFVSFG